MDISKVSTPRGEARSIAPLSPTTVSIAYDGANWMGALAPPRPLAPPEVAGRAFDVPFGYNQNAATRAYEPINFQTLRALADSWDLLRLVIERRKDQICRLPWKIRPRHNGQPMRPGKVSPETSARIDIATDLFRRPSFSKTMRTFVRELLEDVFVTDNASIFLKRDHSGGLISIQNLDGVTIKPVLDPWGRTPEPVIDGQPLPEHFKQFGYTVHNGIVWPVSHQQVLKGLPAISYTGLDIVSRAFNPRPGHAYGLSAVEQVANTISLAIKRAQSQGQYYEQGNIPAGIYNLPESWSVDQVAQFQGWWDSLFVGDIGRRRQMRFVSGNGKYQPFAEPPLKTEVDEWLARVVCFCFSYPPSALVSVANRSIAEQHEKSAEEEGSEPLKQFLAEIFSEIIQLHLGFDDLEFCFVEESEVSQEVQSKIYSRYVSDGVLSINTVRERLGEEPDPDPAANKLMVKTASGYVPIGGATPDDIDAEKMAKGAIRLVAPANWIPRSRGFPDRLTVFSEKEAAALEADGWSRASK